ncbi:MAG TPA: 8-amino-7-oxononanoate synthase [Solirubrobacteraceae bacterium]
MSEIEERLAELEQLGLYRRLRLVSGPQGPRVLLDGKPVLLLCSNNYLGLADHPRVREAAADAAMRWGVGAGASRLVSGTMTIHRRLEERLAAWKGSEACLLFGSGYLANIGTIGALAGRGDIVFSDELNHASIIDGCRLSKAEVMVYRHLDLEHLAWSLRRHGSDGRHGNDGRRRLVVTDSVFSMDGDVAPLMEIVELAKEYGARVMVDEAHAIGALGPAGRGAVAEAGLADEVDVVVGTLGKALGSYGSYVCANEEMIRYLVNTARSLIFSTAPGPPAVAGALAALELLRERPHRVERLRSAARTLRKALAGEGFPVADGEMQIVPLIVGDEQAAMRLCKEALERGVFAQAIRPPTVPAGTSRLRLATMASHTTEELKMAARVLGESARAIGLDPATMGQPTSADRTRTDEREVAEPRLPVGAWKSRGEAPFDLAEQAGSRYDLERSAAQPKVGRATTEADAKPIAEDTSRSGAPFDIEREGSIARAA